MYKCAHTHMDMTSPLNDFAIVLPFPQYIAIILICNRIIL